MIQKGLKAFVELKCGSKATSYRKKCKESFQLQFDQDSLSTKKIDMMKVKFQNHGDISRKLTKTREA